MHPDGSDQVTTKLILCQGVWVEGWELRGVGWGDGGLYFRFAASPSPRLPVSPLPRLSVSPIPHSPSHRPFPSSIPQHNRQGVPRRRPEAVRPEYDAISLIPRLSASPPPRLPQLIPSSPHRFIGDTHNEATPATPRAHPLSAPPASPPPRLPGSPIPFRNPTPCPRLRPTGSAVCRPGALRLSSAPCSPRGHDSSLDVLWVAPDCRPLCRRLFG